MDPVTRFSKHLLKWKPRSDRDVFKPASKHESIENLRKMARATSGRIFGAVLADVAKTICNLILRNLGSIKSMKKKKASFIDSLGQTFADGMVNKLYEDGH